MTAPLSPSLKTDAARDEPSTGFAPTGHEGTQSATSDRASRSAFDVCHVGVVLRAVLWVNGVLAIGAAFTVRQPAEWGLQFAGITAVAMPALLCWLAGVCLAQRPLAGLRPLWQGAVLVSLGALCTVGALSLWRWLQWIDPRPDAGLQTLAVAATGAALAAAFTVWLRQRAQLERPAAAAARLAELQSRIRPHFLFNTLNSAIALVRVDPSRAEAVLEDLSELFRAGLSDSNPQSVATLGEEVELARRYLAIEQVRFGDRLQLRWQLDPAADAARLPPLLLQPLVENAVRHGIEPSGQGGSVRVRTRVRHGRAEITVVNSVPAEASRPGHGIGLQNVRERLRLMHDVAGDFRAGRDGDVYRVQVTVPL